MTDITPEISSAAGKNSSLRAGILRTRHAFTAISFLTFVYLVIRHKALVFRAGLATKAPFLRLALHDLSKFHPAEFPHYAKRYLNSYINRGRFSFLGGPRAENPDAMQRAWIHHLHSNPHHWEYWVQITRYGASSSPDAGGSVAMPEAHVREMIADWFAADRTSARGTGSWRWERPLSEWKWLVEWLPRISDQSHPITTARIELVLSEIFGRNETRLFFNRILDRGGR